MQISHIWYAQDLSQVDSAGAARYIFFAEFEQNWMLLGRGEFSVTSKVKEIVIEMSYLIKENRK